MKNENDYLSSNPGVFQANGESKGYLREHTKSLNTQGAETGTIEASSSDDTGWDEPVHGASNLEEDTY